MLMGFSPGYATANTLNVCALMQLCHAHRLGYKTATEICIFSQTEQQFRILLRRFFKY